MFHGSFFTHMRDSACWMTGLKASIGTEVIKYIYTNTKLDTYKAIYIKINKLRIQCYNDKVSWRSKR